jgi:hypothetical protein
MIVATAFLQTTFLRVSSLRSTRQFTIFSFSHNHSQGGVMNYLTKLFLVFVLVLCATSVLFAQDKKQSSLPAGVRVIDNGDGESIFEIATIPAPVMSPNFLSKSMAGRNGANATPGTFYLAEGFEGPWTFGAPPGWTGSPATNTDSTWHRNEFETGWTSGSSGRLGAPVAAGDIRLVSHMGGYSARFHTWGAAAGTRGSMTSPVFDASGATGDIFLSFWWVNGDGTDPLTVYYSTDGGATFTSLGSVGTTFAPWAYAFAVIPPPYTSTMAIKFEATSDFGVSDIGLDEVLVFEDGPAYSGAATLPGTFSSFTDAVRRLSAYGVSGPLTITVAPGVYTDSITVDPIPGASAVNTVTFLAGGPVGVESSGPLCHRPGTVSVQRSGALSYAAAQNTFDATIILMGCEYVTFDGIDITTPPGGLCEFGYLITNEELDGANYNTITRCIVTIDNNLAGSRGINQGIMWSTSAPGSDAFNAKFNSYICNLVQKCENVGIRLSGSGSGGNMDRDNVVEGNTIFNIGRRPSTSAGLHVGLMLSGQKNVNVWHNDIDSVFSRLGSVASVLFGASASTGDSVVNFSLQGNQIRRIHDSTTTSLLAAIRLAVSAAASYRGRIFNNVISDFRVGNTSTAGAGMAFYVDDPNVTLDIDYNTVVMDNTVASVGHTSIFRVTSATTTEIRTRNNIFINRSTNAGDAHIHRWSSSTTLINFTSSNNTYYIDTTISTRYIGRRGTTNYKSLPAWQAVTGQDANTSYENVAFINGTVAPYDLHVNGAVPSTTESGGIPIAGITIDFDKIDTRHASYPDIGADEYTGTAIDIFGPTIAYTPLPTAANTGDRALSTTITDFSGVAPGGAEGPRLYYKKSTDVTWQVDAAPTGVPPNYNFVISAAALGGVSVGDVIQYYAAAQDLVVPPNSSTNPAGGSGVSPPGSTPPATPNSYVVSTTISSFPYLEDFEDPAARDNTSGFGWYSASVAGGVNEWVRAVPAKLSGAWSGTKAYVTNATAVYQNFHNGAVYSPVFDLSAAPIDPVLRFYHNFDLELNFDAAWLEISTDGGFTWSKHDPVLGTGTDFNTPTSSRWYNNSSTSGVGNPPKWSGKSTTYASQTDTGYIQSVTTLLGTAGLSDVRLRWRMQSDFSEQDTGWVVDDVEVLILDLVGPSISYTKFDTTASLANRTLVATITDNVGVATGGNAPRLYYKKSTDVLYAFVNPTSVAGNDYTFVLDYSLIGGVTGGEIIEYYVAAQDDPAGNVTSNPAGATGSSPPGTTPPPTVNRYLIELTVSTFPYSEDFEDPPVGQGSPMAAGLGWYHKNVRFGASGLDGWVRITPAKPQINAAHSGTKAYVTEAAATYTANYDAVLIAPVFDFSSLVSDPFLEFYFNFKTEADWDGFIVQYSTDGGATWVKQDANLGTGGNFNTVNSQGWYNDGTYFNVFLPGGAPFFGGGHGGGVSSAGYSTAVNGWVRAQTRLNGLAGQSSVRIRFYWSSDEFEVSEGVGIDDVSINLAPANDIGVVSLTSSDVVPPPNRPILKGDADAADVRSMELSLASDRQASRTTGEQVTPQARFLPKEEMMRLARVEEQPKPAGVLGADINFDAIVANFGTSGQASYSVGWAFDGGAQTSVVNTDVLDPGDDDTLTLSYIGASVGIHNARAWSVLSGDQNAANDSSGLFTFEVLPANVVFYQGYESGTFPPAGWITVNADGGGTTGPWFQGGSFVFAPYDGMGKASGNYQGANGFYIDEWLISPNTGGLLDGSDVDSLVFWFRGAAGPWPDSVMILVSTTGTDLGDFTPIDYIEAPQGGWTRFAYVLPNAANRYIAFRYLHYDGGPAGNSSNFMGIDRVMIERCFGCGVTTVGVPVALGWNIVSLPVANPVSGDSVQQVYTNSIFPYGFSFNNGYQQQYVMLNGPAYWIKSSASYTQNITGTPIVSPIGTGLTIPVAAGWNMVGSRSVSTDTGCVVWAGGASRASAFFAYSAGYVVVSSLPPGGGFWVKSAAAGTITLTDCPLGKPQATPAARSIEELNSLTIRDANGGSQTLYFGGDANGEIPVAMYAMPPVPPLGSFDARFASSEDGLMVQTHASELSEAIEFPIAIQSAAYPLTVSWKVTGTDATYELSGAGIAQTLQGEGTLRITNSEVNHLTLGVTGSGAGLPTEYALYQNFPNPFNPMTNIKFALPVESKLTAEIYNILGQRVATLVNGVLAAGYHTIEWNGTNTNGQLMGSGVYFVRLSAEGKDSRKFTEVKKLLLLK